ncbi:MAG: hypothetical protein Q9222_005645 [Ikaeria aurantiellina]
MGRKPNQLVLEYFDRGARLNDNSNRYEQTCKACKAHFPKGRVESLIAHVEKKCPALKEEDRPHVNAQAPASSPNIPDINGSLLDQSTQLERNESAAHQSTLPVGERRSLTGLEALAEASRQLERPAVPGNDLSLQQHHLIDPDLDNASFRPSALGSDLERATYPLADMHGSHNDMTLSSSRQDLAARDALLEQDMSQESASLSSIAASATSLEAMLPRSNGVHLLYRQGDNAQVPTLQQETSTEAAMIHPEIEASAGRTERISNDERRLLAKAGESKLPQHIRPDLERKPRGSSRSSEKSYGRSQKVRGKFTDLRRQEVQNIRKKGACIRCRMLRKTTCASVVSARVWKLDCVRTNIYKELEVFQTGLFQEFASRFLEHYKFESGMTSRQCYVNYVSTESDVRPMSFSSQDTIQGNSQQRGEPQPNEEHEEINARYLNETTEQISSKLLPFMQAIVLQLIDHEPPLLTKQTFVTAKTSGDKLLAHALDLWALTRVIISEPHDWSISHESDGTASGSESRLHHETQTSQRPTLSLPESGKCVTSQLQAAAEQRVSTISKNIMIDLEKRLERKDKCQGAETFFIGIILLNCVERMTWAFLRQSQLEGQYDVCEQS